MSVPSPPPSYVYKILPNTSPCQGTPIPIPSSWEFAKTEVDLKGGFVHLSPLRLLPSTLTRFYVSKEDDEKGVQLLKVDYKRMSGWKQVRWEKSRSDVNGESYPHLYGTLTGEEVLDLRVVKRGSGEGEGEKEGWEVVCRKLEDEGWLED